MIEASKLLEPTDDPAKCCSGIEFKEEFAYPMISRIVILYSNKSNGGTIVIDRRGGNMRHRHRNKSNGGTIVSADEAKKMTDAILNFKFKNGVTLSLESVIDAHMAHVFDLPF